MDHHREHSTHSEHHNHDHRNQHGHHNHHAQSSLNKMAASATMHCLTGCAIGEIAGLVIGTSLGLATGGTVALSVGLAFLFGYTLSTLPLIKSGLGFFAALSIVLAADTLSIATMEIVDNLVMAIIPGAMNAGLVNVIFWIGMPIALAAAFLVAYPVNRWLLNRGKGHALTHEYHHGATEPKGARRFIPTLSTPLLATAIAAFMLGGLLVAVAADEMNGTGSTAVYSQTS